MRPPAAAIQQQQQTSSILMGSSGLNNNSSILAQSPSNLGNESSFFSFFQMQNPSITITAETNPGRSSGTFILRPEYISPSNRQPFGSGPDEIDERYSRFDWELAELQIWFRAVVLLGEGVSDSG